LTKKFAIIFKIWQKFTIIFKVVKLTEFKRNKILVKLTEKSLSKCLENTFFIVVGKIELKVSWKWKLLLFSLETGDLFIDRKKNWQKFLFVDRKIEFYNQLLTLLFQPIGLDGNPISDHINSRWWKWNDDVILVPRQVRSFLKSWNWQI
jgi:hypothetical protein